MNRLEKLTRAVVIALILFILRIRWEFSVTGSTDIEEYGFRDRSATAIKSAEMPTMETL